MRRIIGHLCLGGLAALVCTATVAAQSMNNPHCALGNEGFAVSAEWDQNNRSLELDYDSDVTANWYGLKGTYGVYDWLDLSGFAGAADFDIWRKRGDYETEHLCLGLGGGMRVQALADEKRNMWVILTGAGTHAKSDALVGTRAPSALTWNEFQASLSLAKQFDFALPYVGVTYSVIDGQMGIDGREVEFTDPGSLFFAGIDFILPDQYVLTLQGDARIGGTGHEISFTLGLSQRSR